jgi:hypothetical protein
MLGTAQVVGRVLRRACRHRLGDGGAPSARSSVGAASWRILRASLTQPLPPPSMQCLSIS